MKHELSNRIKIEASSSRINNVGIKKEPNESEWNPVIFSAAELDDMSREEYLTCYIRQYGFCYSIEGDTPERSYTTQEIQAECDRQYHDNVEWNKYELSMCTQGTFDDDEWNPVIVSAAELFKTDEMSREQYLTWCCEQDYGILSIEGDTPERSYTIEEIHAEYERQSRRREEHDSQHQRQRQRQCQRQHQEEHDSQDRHHNVELNMYQSSLCTQGTSESNKYHFGPIPDEYESYYSAPLKQSMDWDRFYEDSEKPQLINPMTKIGCGKWWMYEKDEVLPPAFKILKKRELNFLNSQGIIF